MSKCGIKEKYFMLIWYHNNTHRSELPIIVPLTLLPVPLPTGGCASAACLIVHTISSIRALSCRSDIATEGRKQQRSALMMPERHPKEDKSVNAVVKYREERKKDIILFIK